MRDPLVQVSRLRPPQHLVRRRALPRRAPQGARPRSSASATLAKPGIVYTATRRDDRGARRRSSPTPASTRVPPTTAGMNAAAPRGRPGVASWPTRWRSSSPPRRSGWASTSRTSASSSTTPSPTRSTPTGRRSAAPGATASRPTAMLLYRPRTSACGSFFAGVGAGRRATSWSGWRPSSDAAGGPGAARTQLKEVTDLSESKLTTAIGRLEDVGAVEVRPDGQIEATGDQPPDEAAEAAAEVQADARVLRPLAPRDGARLRRAARHAAGASSCCPTSARRPTAPCGQLRRLRRRARRTPARASSPSRSARASSIPSGATATVQRYEDDKVVVLFDQVGYKALALEAISENDLLRPAPAS